MHRCVTLLAALAASAFVLGAVAAPAQAPARGAAIAAQGTPNGVPPCVSCHGAKGEGNAAGGFPALAGLGKAYLERQLAAFSRGERVNPVMQPIAKSLASEEASAVSAYFAALPAPAIPPAAARDDSPGAVLARQGRWDASRLPACEQCHGPGGSGVGDSFPRLHGQPTAYIAAQLVAWQEGKRPPGPQGLMQAIARKLSPADVAAAAAYFGGSAQAASPAGAPPAAATAQAAGAQARSAAGFAPPPESAIPNDEFGRLVRLGRAIFTDTGKHARAFIGNDLRCSNCHLDAGRVAGSAPLWGAYVAYPQFRAKTGEVDDYATRLQGCFKYSMNGKAPPLGHEVLRALETYSYWLATGAPVRTHMDGAGYPKLKRPADGGDYDRGAQVYQQRCALCHGADGEGQKSAGVQVFPPLWGPRSFNWGAGMHQVNNAAAFIKANMPLGQPGTLSEQEAWDVAYFMDAHERPQDPRFTGSVAETRKRFHDSADSLYGVKVKGELRGQGTAAGAQHGARRSPS